MPKLGVNIDHVATVREARKTYEPNPVQAALDCVAAGADSIVAHLRVDRRHINDKDVIDIRSKVKAKFNLEMSIAPEIVDIALEIKPDQATLVPEKRQEITTEGGLDLLSNAEAIKAVIDKLKSAGIEVSLFIDPDEAQIKAAAQSGAQAIEIHTGEYANAQDEAGQKKELEKLIKSVELGRSLGLIVHAGHGLTYDNVKAVAEVPGIEELNIGHSIVARSIFTGMAEAVKEMKELIL